VCSSEIETKQDAFVNVRQLKALHGMLHTLTFDITTQEHYRILNSQKVGGGREREDI
jgi:hypothetical protein